VGSPCAVYRKDMNDNTYSDCAVLIQCLDVDGKGPHCVDGVPLGGPCGLWSGSYPGWLYCLEGYCDIPARAMPNMGLCRATKPLETACRIDEECTPPARCLKAGDEQRCALHEVGLSIGAPCSIGNADCGPGAYCGPPPGYDPSDPRFPPKGQCTAFKRAGEACRSDLDLCEPFAECVGGVCKGC
jgi:hypothetical protein